MEFTIVTDVSVLCEEEKGTRGCRPRHLHIAFHGRPDKPINAMLAIEQTEKFFASRKRPDNRIILTTEAHGTYRQP